MNMGARRLQQLSAALSSPTASAGVVRQAAGGSSGSSRLSVSAAEVAEPTPAQRFLFDTQGYILLPEVLSTDETAALLARLRELEATDYPDEWVDELGLDRSQVALTKQSSSADYQGMDHQTRLNGLPKIDPIGSFDPLIAHPRVLPFLQAFMEVPQLVNIWSISKAQGARAGGFHAGFEPHDYQVDTRRRIHSKMLNVIWMLTDNGPGDGEMVRWTIEQRPRPSAAQSTCTTCSSIVGRFLVVCWVHQIDSRVGVLEQVVIPGSHKANFPAEDVLTAAGGRLPVEQVPGSVAVHAKAGSVLIMSECTKHGGLAKTTHGVRSNLYFNHVEQRAPSALYLFRSSLFRCLQQQTVA